MGTTPFNFVSKHMTRCSINDLQGNKVYSKIILLQLYLMLLRNGT
jgi:hypothetical protein